MTKHKASKRLKTEEMSLPPTEKHNKHPTSTVHPTFFFKEDQKFGFLCQWYRCTFVDPEYPGISFNCAEQYMMYRKALHFNDAWTAAEILKTSSPGKQKALGRCIEGFEEEKWDEVKSAVVERGNLSKFTQCTNLADMKVDDDLEAEPVPLRIYCWLLESMSWWRQVLLIGYGGLGLVRQPP